MKRTSLIAATTAAAVPVLAGCPSFTTSTDASTSASPAGEAYSTGITQITAHTALDSTRESFKKAFEDADIQVKYDEQNARGDQATATSIASKSASSDLDLVLAIATPPAQAAAQSITKVPVLFTVIADPVSTQLINSLEAPGSNVTDTTDMNPVANRISLTKEPAPKVKTLDTICSSGEVNSEVQAELAEEAAVEDGPQVVESAATSSAEVQQAAQGPTSKVDTIYVLADNTVISALASVVRAAEDTKIPLIIGEANSVVQGAPVTYGVDYSKLGHRTGGMAIRILKGGVEPTSLPVGAQKDYEFMVNTTTLKTLGLEPPAPLKGRMAAIE